MRLEIRSGAFRLLAMQVAVKAVVFDCGFTIAPDVPVVDSRASFPHLRAMTTMTITMIRTTITITMIRTTITITRITMIPTTMTPRVTMTTMTITMIRTTITVTITITTITAQT